MTKKIALVTGANRGLGLQTTRELLEKDYFVLLGVRDTEAGKAAAKDLSGEWEIIPLDVAAESQVTEAISHIEKTWGRLDVLINNAGIFPKEGTWDTTRTTLRNCFETNVLGAFQLCQLAIPLMKKNNYGRIVNVSSGMGQLSDMGSGSPAYRLSKTAINAVTRSFAKETEAQNILVNSICPGWVRTDMGGASATRSLEEGADTIVWAATLEDDGPSGGFFRNRESIPW